jgi:hypothetical protein
MADMKVLRIEVDGQWYAHEWSELISATAEMYSTATLLYLLNDLQSHVKDHPHLNTHIADRIKTVSSLLFEDDQEKIFSFLEVTDFSIESKELKIDVPQNIEVLRIEFGSPGDIDFLGIGKIVHAVSQAYQKTLDFIAGKGPRQADCLHRIETIIKLAKEKGGLSDEEIEKLTVELLAECNKKFRNFMKRRKLKKPPTERPPPKRE